MYSKHIKSWLSCGLSSNPVIWWEFLTTYTLLWLTPVPVLAAVRWVVQAADESCPALLWDECFLLPEPTLFPPFFCLSHLYNMKRCSSCCKCLCEHILFLHLTDWTHLFGFSQPAFCHHSVYSFLWVCYRVILICPSSQWSEKLEYKCSGYYIDKTLACIHRQLHSLTLIDTDADFSPFLVASLWPPKLPSLLKGFVDAADPPAAFAEVSELLVPLFFHCHSSVQHMRKIV